MNVVGKVGSLISQGVYSVATPFHPFGGAVDVIVVQQQDGSFRSTPWYVQFGKFQGVLKGAEKVVRITVNDVEANFHMYLDNSGEAYFIREVDSGRGSEPNGSVELTTDDGNFIDSNSDNRNTVEACRLEHSVSDSGVARIQDECDSLSADRLQRDESDGDQRLFEFKDEQSSLEGSLFVWVQDNKSWGWGFGIPADAMTVAVVSFFSGTRLFRNQKPEGSPLTRLCHVVVASVRKHKVEVPADKSLLYETADAESNISGSRKLDHTKDLSFFDKAAVEIQSDNIKDSINLWRLCTVTQAEELKVIIRLLPIWATGIIFSTVYSQMGTLFVLQGERMNSHVSNSSFKIPPASLSIFDTLSVIFWVPVYDRIIVPVTRKFTGHRNGITQLQRMGIGLFISIISMIVAAILEFIRLRIVRIISNNSSYILSSIMLSFK